MDVTIVSLHVTRQAANIILTSAETLVQHCGEEGILSVRDARLLFEVTKADRKRMNNLISLPRRVAATLTPKRLMSDDRNTLALSPTQTTADRLIFQHLHPGDLQGSGPPITTLGSFLQAARLHESNQPFSKPYSHTDSHSLSHSNSHDYSSHRNGNTNNNNLI